MSSKYRMWVAVTVVGLLTAILLMGSGRNRTSVPFVLGLSEARAEKRLEDHSLEAKVLKRPRGTERLARRYREKGRVVFQDFRPGFVLPTGTKVRVMVYEPPGAVKPPRLYSRGR